jgi:hypothetical protein
MRCPGCDVQNADEATACSACGKALPKRQRRRPSADDPEANAEAELANAAADRAYRLCLYGIVPGAGLLLGPVGMVLAIVARSRGGSVQGFTGRGIATGAILLGAMITATQWAGVTLMVIGWRAAP